MEDSKLSFEAYFLLIAISLLSFWIAFDGNHYWHEIRFLYGTTHFSLDEILSGYFNPHQLGGKIDEISSAGFYLSKVLLMVLLQKLYAVLSPDRGGFLLSVWISMAMMAFSAFMAYKIFLLLFQSKKKAFYSICCYLLIPLTPYLGGKVLSEVPALFFVSVSIYLFLLASDKWDGVRWVYAVFSGVFLLLATLSRLDIVICLFGFVISMILFADSAAKRRAILITALLVSAISLIGELGIIYLLDKNVDMFVQYFTEFTGTGVKSNAMSLLGIFTFGGLVYVIALLSIFSTERGRALFLATWFILSTGIAIAITRNYMVEPRYLVHGLVPLAGLGSLGLEVVLKKISQNHLKVITISGMLIMVTIFNFVSVRLMPYELDGNSLSKAFRKILSLNENASVLVPYSYTDFHYLRVMFPHAPIYNVNTPNGDRRYVTEEWDRRLERWYGDSYVPDEKTLKQRTDKKPVYYLGWGIYPPAEFARRVMERFGLHSISNIIDNLPFKNHLAESWLWKSVNVRFEEAGKCGQYFIYRVMVLE